MQQPAAAITVITAIPLATTATAIAIATSATTAVAATAAPTNTSITLAASTLTVAASSEPSPGATASAHATTADGATAVPARLRAPREYDLLLAHRRLWRACCELLSGVLHRRWWPERLRSLR